MLAELALRQLASGDIPVLAELALRHQLDLEALVTRRIGIDDVETAFTDMTSGRGARSVVCFGVRYPV